jgi:putative tributyrin esterase
MAWLHIQMHSRALRMPVPLDVFLPEYDPEGKRGVTDPGPYPTLYLLHPEGGVQSDWLLQTALPRFLYSLPLAVVLPAGNNSFYVNTRYGQNYSDYITQELPAICETWFRLSQKREDRMVAGSAMGGYGALHAALSAPETFGAAASFSGVLDAQALYEGTFINPPELLFGSREEFAGSENDLFAAAQRLAQGEGPKPRLLQLCSRQDPVYEMNQRWREQAQTLGLPLTYGESDQTPGWPCWEDGLKLALQWFMDGRKGAQ